MQRRHHHRRRGLRPVSCSCRLVRWPERGPGGGRKVDGQWPLCFKRYGRTLHADGNLHTYPYAHADRHAHRYPFCDPDQFPDLLPNPHAYSYPIFHAYGIVHADAETFFHLNIHSLPDFHPHTHVEPDVQSIGNRYGDDHEYCIANILSFGFSDAHAVTFGEFDASGLGLLRVSSRHASAL
ncbi:hypothetical protein HRbin30_03198 [bacterium HR30]|nr:hypothetical protein HRbin30_03198 [bacterium HR30]